MKARICVFTVLYWVCFSLIAMDNLYLDMSLEELFDVDIVVSASKKPEDLFEAPLSISIIKREDISRVGATSLAEALRLSPELIVREQSSGNFDVHIRGFDDINRNILLPYPNNSLILVMIDGRIVYDYYAGGTFWDALPLDISDVERIEIIRGPASAIYGPNAVAGVIHFITDQVCQETGMHYYGRIEKSGNKNSSNALSLGYNWDNEWKLNIFSSTSYRERKKTKYFSIGSGEYVDFRDIEPLIYPTYKIDEQYWYIYEQPDHLEKSLERYAVNASLRWQKEHDVYSEWKVGHQKSESQKAYYNNFFTPFSMFDSESAYLHWRGQYFPLTSQFSYEKGQRENNYYRNEYKFENWQWGLDYHWQWGPFQLIPSLSYREARYASTMFADSLAMNTNDWPDFDDMRDALRIPDDYKVIAAEAASLLVDWRPHYQWRFIGGIYLEDYNASKNRTLHYEIGATYRPDKRNLFRVLHSRASMSPFMNTAYISDNVSLAFFWKEPSLEDTTLALVHFQGNKDLENVTNSLVELEWRCRCCPQMQWSLGGFYSELSDFIGLERTESIFFPEDYTWEITERFINSNQLKARQWGFTGSFDWQPHFRWQVEGFATYQATEYTGNPYLLDLNLSYSSNHTEIKEDNEFGMSTPDFWGGFQCNYMPHAKWNLNVNGYFYGKQKFALQRIHDQFVQTIPAHCLVNCKTTYKVWEQGEAYVNIRNLPYGVRQYGFTDKIYPDIWLGLEVKIH